MVVGFSGGCGAYTEAQMRLVEQARKGVALCGEAQRERGQVVAQFHQMQRQRLDEACDADVRERGDLSAEWVIEHRRAYAAALEVLGRQRQASEEAERTMQRNLDAVDEALRRVLLLQSIQLKIVSGEGMGSGK
jgi:hypothetical protein